MHPCDCNEADALRRLRATVFARLQTTAYDWICTGFPGTGSQIIAVESGRCMTFACMRDVTDAERESELNDAITFDNEKCFRKLNR